MTAGKAVGSASASAVNDTTKWVKEQSESFGTELGTTHTLLPDQTIAEIALEHNVKVHDIIKMNHITSRRQLRPGKDLVIPIDFLPVSPHPVERMQVEAWSVDGESRQFGCLALSLLDVTFTASQDVSLAVPTVQVKAITVGHLSGGPVPAGGGGGDCVPDLMPAGGTQRAYQSRNDQDADASRPPVFHDKASECVVVELDIQNAKILSDASAAAAVVSFHYEDDSQADRTATFEVGTSDVAALVSYLELWHQEILEIDPELAKLCGEPDDLVPDDLEPDVQGESSILDGSMLKSLFAKLPPKIQNQTWQLAFSTQLNGFSLQNLYRTLAEDEEPILLVIHDSAGQVFGAYLTCIPQVCDNFIGTGKSWLFAFDAAHMHAFHWSGRNDYFFRGTPDNIIIGASDGKFGILIDGDLHKGRMQKCLTFDLWPLKEDDFIIHCMECWKFS